MTCDYAAASLKRRVTIQASGRDYDGQGGFVEAWHDLADTRASVEPIRGRESMQAMQLQTQAAYLVVMRYRPGLTTAHRLVFRGRILDIKDLFDPTEGRKYLKLMCIQTGTIAARLPIEEITTPWSDDPNPFEGASESVETIDTPVEYINRPIETIG